MTYKKSVGRVFHIGAVRRTSFLFAAAVVLSGLLMIPAQCLAQFVESSTTKNEFETNKATASVTEFYAAPNGSSAGNGTINSPWDLKTALSRPASVVSPGSTIWLRGGVYTLPPTDLQFVSSLTGTAAAPIKVIGYPGEWATIDGNLSFSTLKNKTILKINGNYTWFMNFEITNTETTNRKITTTSSNPSDRRANSIDDYGTGTKLINLIIHDAGQGIGSWASSSDTEYYGNIVYNNGWDAPDRTHGHGTYIQNNSGSKIIENNIFFNNFSMNAQTGGSSAAFAYNLNYIGNTYFNGNMAWRGPNMTNFKVIGNNFYNNPLKVADEINSTYENAEIRNNYAMSGVQLFEFATSIIFQNNTVWNNDPTGKNMVISHNTPSLGSKFTINNNTYHKAFMGFPFWHFKVNYYGPSGSLPQNMYGDFAYNKTSGSQVTAYNYTGRSWVDAFPFDANSTYVDSAPTGLKVFFQPNRYDSNRANVVIYNWDRANTVQVNLGSFLNPGDTYELRNVQDYFGDVITGTYSGGNLQVSMIGRTRAKPIGYDQTSGWYHDPLQVNTFPVFGGFVLIRTSGITPPVNQAPTVNAGSDQTVSVSAGANLSGTAADDGLPATPGVLTTTWSKVSGPGTVSFGNANSLQTTSSFSAIGTYVLRLTASDGALSSTDDITITVNNNTAAGAISVISGNAPANVSLTTEGASDWTHWGLNGVTGFNRKTGITPKISNYMRIGTGSVNQFSDSLTTYSWTDGTPTVNTGNTSGLWMMGLNKGFQVTVPADTTQKTLKLYVGLWAAGGRLEASLSDGSAPVFVDTSVVNPTSTSNTVFVLNYRAAANGQTLTVKWTVNQTFNSGSNVTLQAATLSGGGISPTNQPPIVNAGSDQTVILPSNIALTGTATDDGLPGSPGTLNVSWSKVSGRGFVSFSNPNSLSTTAAFSISGTYVLRLTVSDGLLTTTDDVTIVARKR